MQFGVGLLGANWDEGEQRARVHADTRAPSPKFVHHASAYAAKVAAETVLAEPPLPADLRGKALLDRLALCGRPARPSEVGMVRDAFIAEWQSPPTP